MAISKFKLKETTKKMALVMPKNCRCPICEATRQKIKNEVGEKTITALPENWNSLLKE